jgi:hypothetical protein
MIRTLLLLLTLSTLLLALQKPLFLKKNKLKNFSSNLPLVVIDIMENDRVHGSYKITAKMQLIEPDESNRSRLSLTPSHEGLITIKRRGSSSERFPKKQYGFSTVTKDGRNQNVSLLGMPSDHKWILNAPYSDRTLMRNHIAYEMTRAIDPSKYYAVRSKFVEVIFEEKEKYTYEGIYLLMEKIKAGEGRVPIKKLKKFKKLRVTGGYIIKLDKITKESEALMYKENARFLYEYPKSEKMMHVQKIFISTYLKSFQEALYSEDYNLTTSPNYYGNWIDIDSFIAHFLSRELFLDADIWMFSEYLHKDENQKLHLSTVWDYNLGAGNDNYRWQGNYQLFGYKHFVNGAPYTISSWLRRLMMDPSFYHKVRMKWKKLRRGVWSDDNFLALVDEKKAYLLEASDRNFVRWRRILDRWVWPNRKTCKDGIKNIYCPTFERSVEMDLKLWMLRRMDWLDKEFRR